MLRNAVAPPETIESSRTPARHQFGLAHLTVLGCAPPEVAYIAAMAGYDLVSYRLMNMGLPGEPNYALASDPTMLRQTKAALAATGVKLNDVELARIVESVDVQTYLPAMTVSAELGARHVISSVWTRDWNYAVDSLGELCHLAQGLGMNVALEFVTWASIATLEDTVRMCREVNSDNLGLIVDTLHFSRSRIRLEELDAVPPKWFQFAHVCDAPATIPSATTELIFTGREARLYPGEGGIDIAGLLNRMPEVPYVLELPNLERVHEYGYAEHARRCLEGAKQYLAMHTRESTHER
jgi:sugar phosphate isomerase/epimerase